MGNQLLTGGTVASGQSILSSPGCTVIEAASFTDARTVALAIAVGVNEGAGFTDSNIGVKSIPVSVAEQVNLTDTDTGVIQTVFLKAVAEGSNFTDTKTEIITGGGSSIAQQLAALNVLTWFAYPNSNLSAVDTLAVEINQQGNTGLPAVMESWSGGVYDYDRNKLALFGGGHTDWSGNEVPAFGVFTGQWELLTVASQPPFGTPYLSDGRPSSNHTYYNLAYAGAPYNKMFQITGGYYPTGNSTPNTDIFDFTINGYSGQPWTRGPTVPSRGGDSGVGGGVACYNKVTGLLWTWQDANLMSYNPATNTYTTYSGSYSGSIYNVADIDTKRNLMVQLAGDYNTNVSSLRVWQLNSPNSAPLNASFTGGAAVMGNRAAGFCYDEVNDRFIGWNGGATLYVLTIPKNGDGSLNTAGTWIWSTLSLAGGVTPTAAAGNGTYGRFRYVPALNAVIIVNATTESVYLCKLEGDVVGGTITP